MTEPRPTTPSELAYTPKARLLQMFFDATKENARLRAAIERHYERAISEENDRLRAAIERHRKDFESGKWNGLENAELWEALK